MRSASWADVKTPDEVYMFDQRRQRVLQGRFADEVSIPARGIYGFVQGGPVLLEIIE